MTPGTLTPARRIPIDEWTNTKLFELEPGDYCGPIRGYTNDKPAVFYRLPIIVPGDEDEEFGPGRMGVGHVISPPHVFSEQPDGSLEIRESILHTGRWAGTTFQWHGYLDAGNIWREV